MGDYTEALGEEIFAVRRIRERNGATEFSHGPGLEPPDLSPTLGYDYALPEDGGRYRGKTPPPSRRDLPNKNPRNVFGAHIRGPRPQKSGRRAR